ncbi:hypothetical protein EXU85_20675 [Spirosoma sp. KCTC 42546]|uniref:hypothetical protein n=1 Tax=Spirosoma sp. KCTC 42546 TaxID=2520506 RepID=UPI00115897C7|nr:hypothetical protein [Spirosoma sp. KCTC 42546]QDK80896.1 hypothetical protein EXU85_20675 [Spirosoma sp. KCTC 42546]
MTLDERTGTVFSSISQPLIGFWGATATQVKDVYEAYTSLWASTPSEAHARDVYDSLVAIALADDIHCPINWLLTELRFEAFAAATGDRKWAALMDLTYATKVKSDNVLDLYNERMTREL